MKLKNQEVKLPIAQQRDRILWEECREGNTNRHLERCFQIFTKIKFKPTKRLKSKEQ